MVLKQTVPSPLFSTALERLLNVIFYVCFVSLFNALNVTRWLFQTSALLVGQFLSKDPLEALTQSIFSRQATDLIQMSLEVILSLFEVRIFID